MKEIQNENALQKQGNITYLSVDEFEELMRRYKAGDTSVLELMVNDYQNLITWEINNFALRFKNVFGMDYIRDELNSFLIRKINSYTPTEGGSFIKYFIVCLKYHMVDLRRELNEYLRTIEKTTSFDNAGGGLDEYYSLDEKLIDKGFDYEESINDLIDRDDISRLKEKIIPALPKNYRDVIEKFYFQNYSIKDIADELSLNRSTVCYRLKEARELMRKLINKDWKNLIISNASDKHQYKRLNKVLPVLQFASKYLDLENEFANSLSAEHKFIFLNYIYNYDGTNVNAIANAIGKNKQYVNDACGMIVKKLEYAVEKKKDINLLLSKVGGREVLDDIATLLDDAHRTILYDYVLSLDYFAQSKVCQKLEVGRGSVPSLKNALFNKINYVLTRKKMAEEFTEMNGGEEFLLEVFGRTLKEKHFYVLANFIMGYHYLSGQEFSRSMGEGRDYALQAETAIIRNLDKFYDRKEYIDGLIERAGGADEVDKKIVSKLNALEKKVFLDYTISYAPIAQDKIAKEFKVTKSTVAKLNDNFLKELQKLVNERQFS